MVLYVTQGLFLLNLTELSLLLQVGEVVGVTVDTISDFFNNVPCNTIRKFQGNIVISRTETNFLDELFKQVASHYSEEPVKKVLHLVILVFKHTCMYIISSGYLT